MLNKIVFNATEARQHFFELLRLVEEGKEPIIINKHKRLKVKLIPVKEKEKKEDIDKILKEMGRIGLKVVSIKKMKKIFESRYDSSLFRH